MVCLYCLALGVHVCVILGDFCYSLHGKTFSDIYKNPVQRFEAAVNTGFINRSDRKIPIH